MQKLKKTFLHTKKKKKIQQNNATSVTVECFTLKYLITSI